MLKISLYESGTQYLHMVVNGILLWWPPRFRLIWVGSNWNKLCTSGYCIPLLLALYLCPHRFCSPGGDHTILPGGESQWYIEAVQKTILLQLENMEKFIQSQEIVPREHADQYSWRPDEDAFDDSDYWQSYHPSASAFFSPLQSQCRAQLQYTQPQYTSLLTNTQPHFTSPLGNA